MLTSCWEVGGRGVGGSDTPSPHTEFRTNSGRKGKGKGEEKGYLSQGSGLDWIKSRGTYEEEVLSVGFLSKVTYFNYGFTIRS